MGHDTFEFLDQCTIFPYEIWLASYNAIAKQNRIVWSMTLVSKKVLYVWRVLDNFAYWLVMRAETAECMTGVGNLALNVYSMNHAVEFLTFATWP